MDAVLLFERLVSIPIAYALSHGISAVKKLTEPHTTLDKPPREQAVPGETSFNLVAVVHSVEFERRLAFLAEIADLCSAQLHFCREFVTGNSRQQLIVAGMVRQVAIVKKSEEITRAFFAGGRNLPGSIEVGNRLVRTERRAFEYGRQQLGIPVVWPHLRNTSWIGNGDKCGQILILGPKRITDPATPPRAAFQNKPSA